MEGGGGRREGEAHKFSGSQAGTGGKRGEGRGEIVEVADRRS